MATNPARLSAMLECLFPPRTVAAELREPGDPGLLFPAEARYVGRAAPKRIGEFAAGRLCARRALAEFGIRDFALEVGKDRQPLWPGGMVGSITHTAGICAAVVAERGRLAAIGIDSEVAGDVKVGLWPSILLPLEMDWVQSLPQGQRAAAATLIFSAKEAFYKCQYPLTQERLGFKDVRVEAVGWDSQGEFRIQARRSIALRVALPLSGRYLFHEEFVTAGLGLAAGEISSGVGL